MRAYIVNRNRPFGHVPEFLKADVFVVGDRSFRKLLEESMTRGTSNLFTTDVTKAYQFGTREAADAVAALIRAITNADCSNSGAVETHIGGTSIIRVV